MSVTLTSQVVPFIDLPAQFRAFQPEINEAFAAIFANTSFISGAAVKEFEADFAKYCQAGHCVSLHNGTVALHLALLALGIGPGDEVITSANTFIATAEAISFAGAKPVFVDCDPITYTIDVQQIEKAITPATKAIIPVHLYGQPADMDAIMAIAKKHNLKVVEDACQAHGAIYKGKRVGSIGDIGCFSFYPGKNLGAAGDGGGLVTNNAQWAEHIKLLRDHGSKQKYVHEIVGHNFRLDTLQAAVLKIKLPHLESWNQARQAHAEYYTKHLKDVPGIVVPTVASDRNSVFHLYVIQVPDREAVMAALAKNNIQCGIHYPVPLHLTKAYENLNYKAGAFPVSEKAAKHILSLPMFAELTEEQQDRVIAAVKSAIK